MSTIRHFGGSRDGSRRSAASELMRFEIQKKGKLPANMRYKRILKKKLEESKKAALGTAYKKPFSLSNTIGDVRKMSARTERALKEIAMKKAAKLAKAERKMVIVQPRNFHNGRITEKGQIFDVAGNMVARVNLKNGSLTTMSGWGIGKYKPKSFLTNSLIEDAINKHSPYFINLRRLQAMQAAANGGVYGAPTQDAINVYGYHSAGQMNGMGTQQGYVDMYGRFIEGDIPPPQFAPTGQQAASVTAWGAMSNNVHGTYADNAWGTMNDNVWGGVSNNIWGGIGDSGGLWKSNGTRIWGTGSGKNYLKGITNFLAGLFGFSTKRNREALRNLNAMSGAGRSGSATRAPSAPRPTGRSR